MDKTLVQTPIPVEPQLAKALSQTQQVKNTLEVCAEELTSVNSVLKEELVEHLTLDEIQDALTKSEDIEDKVQECAEDLHSVNVALAEEIAERKKLEEKLLDAKAQEEKNRYLAYHDVTTGLANRALLNDRLAQAMAQAERHARSFAVLFIDLDQFKSINDTYGHAVGDQVLKMVGANLQACVRDEDTVSRLGGDEFLCLLMEVEEDANVAKVAESMIKKVSAPCEINHVMLGVKPSIGIALYPRDGTSAETLLKNADAAMYKAKQDSNGFVFFNRLSVT